jgi:zinc protease
MVGWHGPDTRNDLAATYAADIFSFILQQRSSKFQEELVDSGLAFYAGLSYGTNKYTGPINLVVVPNPQRIGELMAKVEEHINSFDSDDYFTDEQLQTAKTLIEIDDAKGREKTSEFIHTVTYWWASASIDYYTSYIEKLKQVTRDDIKKYVTTYIKGKPRVTGFLTTKEGRPALEAALTSTPK